MNIAPLVVLFADNDLVPGRRLRGELRRRGAQVLLAGSSDEAIHQAALERPDIVVMDDDLKSDGQLDLGKFLHDAFPHTGILVLHGYSPPTSDVGGLDLLFWGRKPIGEDTLIEIIESVFPGRLKDPVPGELPPIDASPVPTGGHSAPGRNPGLGF